MKRYTKVGAVIGALVAPVVMVVGLSGSAGAAGRPNTTPYFGNASHGQSTPVNYFGNGPKPRP